MAHELQVRRPGFRIDASVPAQWQPANPEFGAFCNVFTFIAIAFERYIVAATRQAMPLLQDGDVVAEADAFLRQEAQHARAHRAHAHALIEQYPGLKETLDQATASYDELLAREPLAFHLAYIADLEATFTPLFKMVLDNRRCFFDGGDDRVGTLFLWHFVEEIEHRSSALVIYDAVVGSHWYRVRQSPKVFRHVTSVYSAIVRGLDTHVPAADRGVAMKAVSPTGLWRGQMLRSVPKRELRTMARRLAASQMPGHKPAHERLPEWAAQWHAAFDAGDDVTTYDGARL